MHNFSWLFYILVIRFVLLAILLYAPYSIILYFSFSVIAVEAFSQVGVIKGKVLGGSIDNEFVQIQKTLDNHYLISESTTGWYMVKMDTLFNLIWQKSVTGGSEFALTSDSGFVVVSSQQNEAHSWSPDVAIRKYDKNGD